MPAPRPSNYLSNWSHLSGVLWPPPFLAFIREVTVFSMFKLTDTEKFLWISIIYIFPIKHKHCTMCQQVVYFHIYTILVICGKSWANVTWPPKLAQCAVVGRCCRYCTQVFLANNLRVYSQLRAKHHRCNTIFHNQLQLNHSAITNFEQTTIVETNIEPQLIASALCTYS